MNIKEQEKQLFQEWKLKRPKFIPDGIVDENSYLESNIKVLYILKEVNGGANWDLREFLRKGEQWRTWNNIVRWQYGIENLNGESKFSDIADIDEKKRKKFLNHIAVINIKKESGGSSSNMEEIWSYSWTDREMIKKQIEIYKPEIIICCGTGKIVQERSLAGKFKEWIQSKNGIEYKKINNHLIINYFHPQYRNQKKEKLYLDLIETIKEAKKEIE